MSSKGEYYINWAILDRNDPEANGYLFVALDKIKIVKIKGDSIEIYCEGENYWEDGIAVPNTAKNRNALQL